MFVHYRLAPVVFVGFMVISLLMFGSCPAHGQTWPATYQNFDAFTPTVGTNNIPGNGGGWNYGTNSTASSYFSGTEFGFYNTTPYSGGGVNDVFYWYANNYNTMHMGMVTYGYWDIDNTNSISGNSLRGTVTGGYYCASNCGQTGEVDNQCGTPLFGKANYLSVGSGGVCSGSNYVGSPYYYFANTSNPTVMPIANGANRLSFYVMGPSTQTNGGGGSGSAPGATIEVGTFNQTSSTGFHWYHTFYTNGGAWTHIQVDDHPQHNNAGSYTNNGDSFEAGGTAFLSSLFKFYVSYLNQDTYMGLGVPPYNVWLDNMYFDYDSEPQNEETINSVAVAWFSSDNHFEISFNDKYLNVGQSNSSYQVRYSFSPITNANFASATPVHVQAYSGFGEAARTDGIFGKWWPYYEGVWAAFNLANSADIAKLTAGTKIYFAILDISQAGGSGSGGQARSDGLGGNWPKPAASCGYNTNNASWCGRDYTDYSGSFDYGADQAALLLIKRTDFLIPGGSQTTLPAPTGLKLLNP
jgi:hypothetical protein